MSSRRCGVVTRCVVGGNSTSVLRRVLMSYCAVGGPGGKREGPIIFSGNVRKGARGC